ncbi:MAG: Tad domain-containing protein [Dehalococcoidia bacterium]
MTDGQRKWMRIARRVRARARWSRGERGQMIMMFALLVVPITFVLGAVAVDASIWQSERRGAYKDADLSALAGALELAKPVPDGVGAEDEAYASAATNDEAGNAGQDPLKVDVTVDNSCFPNDDRDDGVSVNLTHESRTFFSSIFGMELAPDIGAHAKACAGAAGTATLNNFVPFEIDHETSPCFEVGQPVFTKMCGIEYGAQGGPAARGLIDMSAPDDYCSDTQGGVSNVDEMIAGNVDLGDCEINTSGDCDPTNVGPWYDCVSIQPGNAQKILDGVRMRIAKEELFPSTPCDPDGNGIHEFADVVRIVTDTGNPTTSIYEAVDCDLDTEGDQISPRMVTIVVLEEKPSGNASQGRPIWAFAGFYLIGCASEVIDSIDEDHPDLNKKCDIDNSNGNSSAAPLGSANAEFVQFNAGQGQCGRGNQATCTPIPGGPTATPTPDDGGPGGGGPGGGGPGGGVGHVVVYGKFVNLITAGSGTTAPTEATTIFSISLVE